MQVPSLEPAPAPRESKSHFSHSGVHLGGRHRCRHHTSSSAASLSQSPVQTASLRSALPSLSLLPHLQLGVQIGVRGHHVFVLLLAGDLNERLFGFPKLLLELVDHRGVLALDEAVQVVPGVATAITQRLFQKVTGVVCSEDSSWKNLEL